MHALGSGRSVSEADRHNGKSPIVSEKENIQKEIIHENNDLHASFRNVGLSAVRRTLSCRLADYFNSVGIGYTYTTLSFIERKNRNGNQVHVPSISCCFVHFVSVPGRQMRIVRSLF